jgi:Lon protease-like protein
LVRRAEEGARQGAEGRAVSETDDFRPATEERDVALFPLPGVVLFPSVNMPFYVFEPRYRAMLAHALDGDGMIGVPLLKQGERDAQGRPAIHHVFGVGRVIDYETHDDGTSHIELGGAYRARLVAEIPSEPYRVARVRPIPERAPSSEDARSVKQDLIAAVRRLEPLGMAPEAKAALERLFVEAGDDASFLVNVMATTVVAGAPLRQSLLEEDRVYERGRALAVLLETLRQELEGGGRGPSSGRA